MSEPTINDMNEAISIFDGWEKISAGEFVKDGYMRYAWEFEYYTSWDALMPVGKKIYDLLAEMTKKRPPHTACHGDLLEVDIHCHIREYDRAKAHKAIYEFVQWYNKQKEVKP